MPPVRAGECLRTRCRKRSPAHSQSRQKCHAAHGEVLRRSQSIGHRQFQHQIDTALNGKTGTGELVQQGSITTLDEVAAHDGNDPLCTAAANLFQMIQVSVVQGLYSQIIPLIFMYEPPEKL